MPLSELVQVSVLVPCCNAAEFLADALHSVRNQTFARFECIIVDDASTDSSAEIAKEFANADKRFKLIRLSRNEGISAARNTGIAKALGRWIALLDADDLFMPGRLEELIAIGEAQSADMVVDEQIVTEFPASYSTSRAFGFSEPAALLTQDEFFASRLYRRSLAMGYMKPIMRADFLARIQAAYDPTIHSGEDFLFYADLFAERPKCIATASATYVYRRRRGSLSRSDEHLHFHAALGERVIAKHGDRLSERSLASLRKRKREFERLARAIPALNAFRDRNWPRLTRALISEPSAIGIGLRLARMHFARWWDARRPAITR